MMVSLEWLYASREPEALAMLQKVAASPGDKVPKVAASFAKKVAAKRAASAQAAAK
jgi:hypothetical protein